jgi:hypothetical protein
MGGMVGGTWWIDEVGQYFQYGQEDDPLDQNLYEEAYELIDYLDTKSISTAGQWVRNNLAEPRPAPKNPLYLEME